MTVFDNYSTSTATKTITVGSHTTDLGIFSKAIDIGVVSATGGSDHTTGIYSLNGSGDGFGDDSSDELHFLHRAHTGDLELIARSSSLCNAGVNTRSALMARNTNAPDAYYFAVESFPNKTVRCSWRDADGEDNSVIFGNTTDAKYLRLLRSGDYFIGYYSTNSSIGPWTQIGLVNIPMDDPIFVGLGVSSGVDGQLCSATFDNVSINLPEGANPTLVKARVNLQGPWNGADMSTTLFQNTMIPLGEPFSAMNFNFNGNEVVLAYPTLDNGFSIVDWILLQIHDPADKDCIVAQRACFIRNDGWIVDLDGSDEIDFGLTNLENGYLSIKHRNHLGVMTENPVDFN